MLKVALWAVAVTVATFIFYLAYCAIWEAKRNGKLALAPWPVKVVVYLILGVALVLDVLFNFFIGSFIFLEPPNMGRPLFTQRCKRHLEAEGWRGDIARTVCNGWLNPFQAGHC